MSTLKNKFIWYYYNQWSLNLFNINYIYIYKYLIYKAILEWLAIILINSFHLSNIYIDRYYFNIERSYNLVN